MLRRLMTIALVAGFASEALSAEPDSAAALPKRPRPTASAPT